MRPEEIHQQRILLSPLNWGMGHVSRCIGLVHQLRNQHNTVIIACDEAQKAVFQQYFDDVEFVHHAPYPFSFSGKGRFSNDLLRNYPSLKRRRKVERIETEQLVKTHNIDLVISDHRYGFRSELVPSIFVTHQLNLPVLWFELAVQFMHTRLIKRFDRVWVMDFADSRLAGKLSQNQSALTANYIGPYSRFQLYEASAERSGKEVLIVSGPTVYGQQFMDEMSERAVEVIAAPEIDVHDHVRVEGWREQDAAIRAAKGIISRSGYSTIMDVHYLGVPAELSATPGQREQVYLAKRFSTIKKGE